MSIEAITKAFDKFEGHLNKINAAQLELADRVTSLEQRGGAPMLLEHSHKSGTVGLRVAKAFDQNRELFEKTRNVRLEIKAAGDPVTTASGRMLIGVGVGAPQGGVLGLQNGLPSRGVSATAAEYSRYTGIQGAAGVQTTEGQTKPAVRPDHTIITQSAITIAGYTKMSRQAMNDSAELAQAVDTTLNRSVALALDVALVNGVAAPAFTGFESLATASTSLIYTSLPDAISEGVAAMQVAGFAPDVVGLNPVDWLAITVAKGSDGHYLSAAAYLGILPMQLRGLRVVISPTVDAGKALLMDSSHSELLVVEGFAVEAAYDSDDFTKNLVTVLGEMRVIPVYRTVGSARLITPKP